MNAVKLLPGAEVLLELIGELAAEGFELFMKEALDLHGSGMQWPGNPNRSSRAGEYPVVQSGALLASIGRRKSRGHSYEVGAIINPPPEAVELQTLPESKGGRHWAEMLITSEAAREATLNHVRTGGL